MEKRRKVAITAGAGALAAIGGVLAYSKPARALSTFQTVKGGLNALRPSVRAQAKAERVRRYMAGTMVRVMKDSGRRRLRNARKGAMDLREIKAGALRMLQPTDAAGNPVGPQLFGTRDPGRFRRSLGRMEDAGRFSRTNAERMVEQLRAGNPRNQVGPVRIRRVK